MIRYLFDTSFDRTLTFVRVVAGSVMLAHGAQKMLGLFGGPGYAATMGMFGQMGIPAPLAASHRPTTQGAGRLRPAHVH